MTIETHQKIDRSLSGTPLELRPDFSRVELVAEQCMAADASGLVHGGFVFSLADYAAMIAVNHPNTVLGSAEVRFLKPVRVGERLIAEAVVEQRIEKKILVRVSVLRGGEAIFDGMFTCFAPQKHVLASA
ncbi:MAG: thioesterase [Deltaproteobacteria bacterium]|nr:thioesterase [Deltaproteobacteria bacterium]